MEATPASKGRVQAIAGLYLCLCLLQALPEVNESLVTTKAFDRPLARGGHGGWRWWVEVAVFHCFHARAGRSRDSLWVVALTLTKT